MRKLTVPGPLHPIRVSLVTNKYLNKIVSKLPEESVLGAYVPDDNIIYIAKTQEAIAKSFTFWHELFHAFEHQTISMTEEARCDAFASWIQQLLQPAPLEEFLEERNK